MPFQKGCKRAPTSGRQPGSRNKNTAEVIAAAKTQIGKMFNDLGGRNTLMLDDELRQRMQDAIANYKRLGGTSPGVEGAAESLLARNHPEIAGDVYTAMRSGLGKDAQSLRKSDPVQAHKAHWKARCLALDCRKPSAP